MASYNTLEMVELFVQDIYGVECFFRNQLPSRFRSIPPLETLHKVVFQKCQEEPSILDRKTHTRVFSLRDSARRLSIDEFEQNVLPFLEAAFLWDLNKGLGLATSEFRFIISERIRRGDASAFYGYLNEVHVSGLYIFDGWTPLYAEKLAKEKSEKSIEWVFQKNDERRIGIECKDQRQRMQQQDKVSLVDVEQRVNETVDKFSAQSTKSFNLERSTLWLNVTNMRDYAIPSLVELGNVSWRKPRDTIAGTLTPEFSLRNKNGKIDALVLAWREKVNCDNGFDYIQRYVIGGDLDCYDDLPRLQPLIHFNPGKHLFIRKYVFPEPQVARWGPEETFNNSKMLGRVRPSGRLNRPH